MPELLDAGPLSRLLRPHGLLLRGAFHPRPEESVPALADRRRPATLVLVGNAGAAMWQAFRRSRPASSLADPLDAWTRTRVSRVAEAIGATAVFPFDGPPFWPFQRWAARADNLWPSPLGLLLHPRFGPWHAYRAALLLGRRLRLRRRPRAPSPCADCAQPCVRACPVSAFGARGYAVARCRGHLAAAAGRDCLTRGCRARHACPLGRRFAYRPAQAEFHMRAFAGLPGGASG